VLCEFCVERALMPIHDQGYRRYGGSRAPRGQAWSVITRAGLRTMLAKRMFLGLLLVAWFPFFVRAVQIYAAANMPQAAFLKPTAETFRQFLDQQSIFVFFVTVYVGAGLIANDRRANALQIYLSKPLTRAEYVFGKLAILMTFLLAVTWAPAMVLLLVQIAFAGNFTFFQNNLYLFPAITVFAAVEVITVAATMLALSSLSKSARYVAILYAMVLFFSSAIYGVLYAVTRSSSFSWISLSADLEQVGNIIFRMPAKYDTPWPVSLLVIVVTVALCGWVLERRVRGVEVVS
jgi:ABC-2 type transport system permease protein